MRTIETKVYEFNELSEEAKEKAIDNMRTRMYDWDIHYWVIDDCYLLNPKGINDLIIGNTRKIYYSLDRDRYIDISNGMEINNDIAFLEWLKIPFDIHDKVYYTIGKDTIEFEENEDGYTFTENELEILDNAKEIFEDHCHWVLNCIESSVEYYFSDEGVIEDIQCNEYEFTEKGNII
jgi:hypothetical protein